MEATRGRSTWVFQGYHKGHPKQMTVVMKDTWRSLNCNQEDVILKGILSDMEKMMSKATVKDAWRHFLTVLDAEDVSIDGDQDNNLPLAWSWDTTWLQIAWDSHWSSSELKKASWRNCALSKDGGLCCQLQSYALDPYMHCIQNSKTLYEICNLCGVTQALLGALKGVNTSPM